MTWIIILSIFIIVGLFFCGLFAGKLSTYKRVPKLVQDYISRDNTLNFEAFKGGVSLKEDGPSFGTFILSYLVLMALIFLVGTFCDWKNSDLIVQCELFDAKHILEWAQKGEFEFATECLKAQKKEYSAQDLEDMQCLYDFFANLPEKVGRIEERNDDRRHKIMRIYICDHRNYSYILSEYEKTISYCPHCKKGKKGLTQEQEERVKEFGIKIETLKELLS